MNDFTEASIWPKPNKQHEEDQLEDMKILINNDLPGPVRNTWTEIKDKELLLIHDKKQNNIYTLHYQLRDTKIEMVNFINYTWQDLKNYNLPSDILALFKKRLERLYKLI
jgi:hypothetical protein